MAPDQAASDAVGRVMPRVVAELVFGDVAVQMLRANLVVDADHTALEQAEEAF